MYKNDECVMVSIVCAWFNRGKYIKSSIDSLLEQNFSSFEIIVVNDGSPDPNVKAVLDSYHDVRMKVIHQENAGFTAAITTGINAAQGRYIAIHGAGDRAEKNKIRKQFEYLEANREVVALGCSHYLCRDSGERFGSDYDVVEDLTKDILKKRVPFTHGTVMYRASALRKAGGYDQRFKYSQDWELYWRIIEFGAIRALKDRLYDKCVFEDGASHSPKKKFVQYEYSNKAREKAQREIHWLKRNRFFLYIGIAAFMLKASLERKDFKLARLWMLEVFNICVGGTYKRVDRELFWVGDK